MITPSHTTQTIRSLLQSALKRERLQPGSEAVAGTIELVGASFLADDVTIFGAPSAAYVQREIEWYKSQICNVFAMEGPVPKIWLDVSTERGEINSNYGHLLFSEENGDQFRHVARELSEQPDGRRATAIYTRPTMHTDWCRDGMSDFICTNAVCYFKRDGAVHAVVQMRSNDVVFGYRNDYAWQRWVLDKLAYRLDLPAGEIVWQAASLHLYERHWSLAEES